MRGRPAAEVRGRPPGSGKLRPRRSGAGSHCEAEGVAKRGGGGPCGVEAAQGGGTAARSSGRISSVRHKALLPPGRLQGHPRNSPFQFKHSPRLGLLQPQSRAPCVTEYKHQLTETQLPSPEPHGEKHLPAATASWLPGSSALGCEGQLHSGAVRACAPQGRPGCWPEGTRALVAEGWRLIPEGEAWGWKLDPGEVPLLLMSTTKPWEIKRNALGVLMNSFPDDPKVALTLVKAEVAAN